MAYQIDWDENSPDGATTLASTIDSELQDLKTSIRERLEDIIDDWQDDGTDPKLLNRRWVISEGSLANRPATPLRDGEAYYASDVGSFYVASGSSWNIVGSRYVGYNADASVGSKQTTVNYNAQTIAVRITGTTDGFGIIQFDLSEISNPPGSSILNAVAIMIDPGGASFARSVSVNTLSSSSVQFLCKDAEDASPGNLIASSSVTLFALITIG